MNGPFLKLWGIPLLLGASTILGLVSALLGDGIWDIVSACARGAGRHRRLVCPARRAAVMRVA